MARLVRSVTLVQRNQAYVDAGVALGYSDRRIIFRHILPNLVAAIVVQSSIDLAYAILDIAALSFLGLGQQPPDPDWGSMLSDGRSYLLQNPLPAMSAGLAIMLAVIAFNLVGDGLARPARPPGTAAVSELGATPPLLDVTGLRVSFRTLAGAVHAVNGLDLRLAAGEIVGLVGESGSGKSVTSRAIMGLLPRRTSDVTGSVKLAGRELVGLPESEYRRVRGEQVAIDLPGPDSPRSTRCTGRASRSRRRSGSTSGCRARRRAPGCVELLGSVGLPDPAGTAERYPHELSGRDAPAGDDRHGPCLRAVAAHRG